MMRAQHGLVVVVVVVVVTVLLLLILLPISPLLLSSMAIIHIRAAAIVAGVSSQSEITSPVSAVCCYNSLILSVTAAVAHPWTSANPLSS